jgi:hypothetical protein
MRRTSGDGAYQHRRRKDGEQAFLKRVAKAQSTGAAVAKRMSGSNALRSPKPPRSIH